MQTEVKKIDLLNKIIYTNLSGILKKMNRRIHIKLYALAYDKNQKFVETIRVKKTVAKANQPSSVSQDAMQNLTNVFAELKIEPTLVGDTYDDIKQYFNHNWYKQSPQIADIINDEQTTIALSDIDAEDIVQEDNHLNETRILYANQIPYQVDKNTFTIVYIIEIRNVENEVRQLFYTKPEISFLRMLLDYFFNDYFTLIKDYVMLNKDDNVDRKYNEDSIQFNRRLTRLFFGKMQNYLVNNSSYNQFGTKFEHELNNQYYVNNLLEKIDDISTLTYESASPFGSILFMNKDIIDQPSIIRFTVKFTLEDRIRLEDAKRIRKLLELTNVDKDLYLIADEKEVYGLGEVNWNLQKDALALRLDFTGLSKYNVVLIRTETEVISNGVLLVEDEKKFYRSDLGLIETNLIAVSFKNPRLGEEGYSSEKFTKLLKSTFWENHTDHNQISYKLERLDRIVRKAREQKQGTMVVITEPKTAKEELEQLSKQSTLIEPGIINPEYIKFLTAIDGAIYFDIDGNCHAIGVILDGVAKEDIGDSSRGARYNSAQRYLQKLKDNEQKKCVIVIISEDGMVDLIPELEHEDMLLDIAEEIIDLINEEDADPDKLKEKEDLLLQSKIVDSDWLFNIAKIHIENSNTDRAIDFLEYGRKRAEKSYIPAMYYNWLGNCYRLKKRYEDAIEMYGLAINNTEDNNLKGVCLANIGYSYFLLAEISHDTVKAENCEKAINRLSQSIELINAYSKQPIVRNYNFRGRSYLKLNYLEKSKEKKNLYLEAAIKDFSQAIKLEPNESAYYWNRSLSYIQLGQIKASIEDLIKAEYIEHDDRFINKLTKLFEDHHELVSESLEFYQKLKGETEKSSQLSDLLSSYMEIIEKSELDEVAADKAHDIDTNEE